MGAPSLPEIFQRVKKKHQESFEGKFDKYSREVVEFYKASKQAHIESDSALEDV